MLKRLDDEREARYEREDKAKAEQDRKEIDAELVALAAEREADRVARVEVETAEITALVGDPVALVRLVRSLVVRLEKLEAANRGPSHKAAGGAGIDVGVFANGTAYGARDPIVVEPNMERNRADQKAQLSRLGYGR
jgi:hypothetical protein